MRHLPLAIAACLATACGFAQQTTYQTGYVMRYSITPRAMLWNALQAARSLHYSVVAIESPDVNCNVFLAFGDDSPANAPTALLVEISSTDALASFSPETAHTSDKATFVAVEPLAFRGGMPVPSTQVPARTLDAAQLLVLAIDQQNRGQRIF